MMKEPRQYNDIEVIGKILGGDTELFEIVIRRNNPFLYKAGRCYGYNHQDTQDLMQDTFINAYIHLSRFENRSSLKTWLLKIMLHNCFRKKQKLSFKNEVINEIKDGAIPIFSGRNYTDTSIAVMNKELNFVIETALQKVPLDYRLVFSLREINGLDISETAEILNISETNVKVRLNRAKAMLRNEMERSYSVEDIFEFNLIYCDVIVNNVMNKILVAGQE